MLSSKLKFLSIVVFGLMMVLTSCNKEDSTEENLESYTESAVRSIQGDAVGRKHCLEFVFPITVQFVDSTTTTAEDHESLKTAIKAWFTTNDVEKSRENRPSLVFPIQVVNEAGEIVDVASREELRELAKDCPRRGKKGKRGKKGFGRKCFELVFPVSLTIGGEDMTFENRRALKEAVRAYRKENGKDAVRPTLVYPVTIKFEDGSEKQINSKEELKAEKEACKED